MIRTGQTLVVVWLALAGRAVGGDMPPDRLSGYTEMSDQLRAMQDDAAANPGMLWVLEGEMLWNRVADQSGLSCASCHGEAPESMKGVTARYPTYDRTRGRAIDIEERIRICRTE